MPQGAATLETRAHVLEIPYPRNPHFTGRQQVLAALHARLSDQLSPTRCHVLSGLGGVGKSQIAVEYAYRHQQDWKLVAWLPAEDPTSLGLAYARLAPRLGMKSPAADASLDEVRHHVRRALGESDDWLLIFDNAPGPDAIRNYLPTRPSGRALVTSQNAEWGALATVTRVREMNRDESVEFLIKRTHRDDPEQAGKLAKALGDLPLAMEQAAAVIEHTGASYASYLKRFETHWAELLQRGRFSADHPDSLAMTLELSFRQVADEAPHAVSLLHLCAFLHPEGIAKSLLAEGMRLFPSLPGVGSHEIDRLVAPLARYSLIDVSDGAVSLHRLTWALARQRLSEEEKIQWATVAVELTAGAMKFDGQDPATWASCGAVMPHALTAAVHAERLGVSPQCVVDVYSAAGRYLLKQSRLSEARPVLERALDLTLRLFGEDHPRLSDAANNLARVLQRLGDCAAAAGHYERALSIDRRTYGEVDPRVAAVANNFATCLLATGDPEGAAANFERALAVYEQHYGIDHPKVASVMNNLGCALRDSGRAQEARERFGRALTIAESACGPAHPTTASVLYNFAVLLRQEGQLPAAENCVRRALAIDERAFGAGHPDVARDLFELSNVLAAQGLEDDAKPHAARAQRMLADFNAAASQRAGLMDEQLRAAG